MIYRIATVAIQPGRYYEYWRWAREVLDFWQEQGIQQVGVLRAAGPAGEGLAILITAHQTEQIARQQFQEIAASERGKELYSQRPSLIAELKVQFATPVEFSNLK